jgi:hypothetical protein
MYNPCWRRNDMRPIFLVLAAGALMALPVRGADVAKVLENIRGIVSYQTRDNAPAHDLAPAASIALRDDDVARTGAQSQGAITMPDSSRITLGANTTVKLDVFAPGAVARAHFVLFEGKTRFRVEHPKGASADYTFATPTAEVGVRGTEGDIAVDAFDGVRINVYHTSDPLLPVHVTTVDGKSYDVPGGSKIWVRWQSGALVARVTTLTKAELSRFDEFGPPATIDGGPPQQ